MMAADEKAFENFHDALTDEIINPTSNAPKHEFVPYELIEGGLSAVGSVPVPALANVAKSGKKTSPVNLDSFYPEDNERYRNTDIGRGRLFADVFKDIARYVPERKSWFIFDGTRWAHDGSNLMVDALCKRLADALWIRLLSLDGDVKEKFAKGWMSWQDRRKREIILRDAASEHPKPLVEFDADPYLLNVLNGTFNLRTFKFHKHQSSDFLSKVASVKYDLEAKCPRWDQFIVEVMSDDKAKARFLQRALGYAVSGITSEECLFILHGVDTRNGKSTTCETVLGILGDYGATVQPDTLSMGRKTDGGLRATEDVARLEGVRFANVSEPGRGLTLNVAKLKALTGGDSVNARRLFENSFEYRPQFKLFVNTNFLPVVNDTTLFTSGRVVVVPFDRHFGATEQDTTLKQRFAEEEAKSSILTWLLNGWVDYNNDGLEQPDSVKVAIGSYERDSDTFSQFAEECLVEAGNAQVRTSEVYTAYKEWTERNGYRYENTRVFKNLLVRIGTVERRRPDAKHSETTMLIGFKLSNEGMLFDA
ncbi:MAG: hypothetical protein LBK67_10030 [Coriobacteriales bacterium]|jgi:putative DNA primase/helicase|nr:hypothetical protein [Coriobacteriales bacterium]